MSKDTETEKAVEEATVTAAATMQGDLMQCIVDELKLIDKPWQKLSETHQGEILERLEKRTESMIKSCVSIISVGNHISVPAELDSVKFSGGVNITLKAKGDAVGILDLATHAKGGSVRVVIIDAEEYVSDKDSIPEADADQNILDLGADD